MNDRQRLFIAEYLVDLNATQAALRAGYNANSARVVGAENLTKPDIARAVELAKDKRAARVGISADRVLLELGAVGFSDARDLFDDDGNILAPKDWPDAIAHAVASVEVVTRKRGGKVEHVHKVRLWPKQGALDTMAKHVGVLDNRPTLDGMDLSEIPTAELLKALGLTSIEVEQDGPAEPIEQEDG